MPSAREEHYRAALGELVHDISGYVGMMRCRREDEEGVRWGDKMCSAIERAREALAAGGALPAERTCKHRSPLNYDRTRYATCSLPAEHSGDHGDGEFRWTDRTMPCRSPKPAGGALPAEDTEADDDGWKLVPEHFEFPFQERAVAAEARLEQIAELAERVKLLYQGQTGDLWNQVRAFASGEASES